MKTNPMQANVLRLIILRYLDHGPSHAIARLRDASMKNTWLAFLLLAGSALFTIGCAARYYQPRFSPGYSRYDRHHIDGRDHWREDHRRDERREHH